METTTLFLPKPHPLLSSSSSFRNVPSTLRPRRRTSTSSLAFPQDLALTAAALTAAALGARLAFAYHFLRRKHQDDALGGVVDRGEGKEREFRFGRSILEEEGEVSEAVNKDAKRNEIDDHVRRDRDEVSGGNEMAFCSGHSVPGDDGVSEVVNTDAKTVENDEFITVDRAFAEESLDVVAPAFETSSICSEVYLGSTFTQIVEDNFMVGESSVGGEHLPLVHGYDPLGRSVGEIETVSRPKLDFAFMSKVPRQFSLQGGLGARALTTSSSSSRRAELPFDKLKGITPTSCYRESSPGDKDESCLKRRSQYNRRRFVQKTKIKATTRHPRSDAMLGGGRSNPKRGKSMDYSGHSKSSTEDAMDPPSSLRSYSRLLRDARLKECVELLEDMVTRGLLDMDKFP